MMDFYSTKKYRIVNLVHNQIRGVRECNNNYFLKCIFTEIY